MSESTRDEEQVAEEEQAASGKQRVRRLPPGSLDVIYTGGFPPFWKIWKKRMMTIPPPESRPRR